MKSKTLLGKEIIEDLSLKKCCNLCGFPVDIGRKPVFITDSVLSLVEHDHNTCESCGHQRDGSTIPVVYELIQELHNEYRKERGDLIKFLKHYNTKINKEDVCVWLPRFCDKRLKPSNNPEDDDVLVPYSWNVVYSEVIYNTKLSRIMVRDIDWEKVE
jgi:hypothetical protein